MSVDYLFPPKIASVPLMGRSARFPVGRIFCVGRNTRGHAAEMGSPAEPVFFMKSPDCVAVGEPATVKYPSETAQLEHEVELVLALHKAANIGEEPPEYLLEMLVGAVGVGIDLTRRDLQAKAKETGGPWEAGKNFPGSAIVSKLVWLDDTPIPKSANMTLQVNRKTRQYGDISDYIQPPLELVRMVCLYFGAQPGDLIFCGTPAGVGPVAKGDVLQADIEGIGRVEAKIT